jgi:hypothetical protein
VEAHLADAAGTQSGLEALEQLRAVDGLAGVRVREDELVVAAPQRFLVQEVELAGEPVGERHAARRALGLGRAELAAHVGPPHPHAARGPVDVAPAQPEQFALAHAGHRGREVHPALDAAKVVVRYRAQQRLDVLGLEVADVGIARRRLRLVDERAGVRDDPAFAPRELEDRMQDPDRIERRLRGAAAARHEADERLDSRRPMRSTRCLAKNGTRCTRMCDS